MTATIPSEYVSPIPVPPGETIKEMLDGLGMTQSQLAARMGINESRASNLVHGEMTINEKTAISLHRVLGYPADFWLNLEKSYRLSLAQAEETVSLEGDAKWMRETIPLAELKKRGCIVDSRDSGELLASVLEFFGVSTVQAFQAYWEEKISTAVAFRRSEKQESKHIGRVAAWLRLAEIEAEKADCSRFDKRAFESRLKQVREATNLSPTEFLPILERLSEVGVVVSFVKEFPGAGISGATMWYGKGKAQIALTLLHKTDDQFWFSFFHEAAHILLHGKDAVFLTEKKSADDRAREDKEADQWSADFLIPPKYTPALQGLRSRQDVVCFAQDVGISPGIVAGRMQHEGLISPKTANFWKLKRRFDWTE